MRPVLLFAVGVVVLAVGAAARPRHLQGPTGQILVERPVEELAAVVAVEARHGKRHLLFQLLHLGEDGMAALVPDGAVLGPAAEKLCKREGIASVWGLKG